MKTSVEKSSHTTPAAEQQKSAQPFFAKAGGGDFFAPVRQGSIPSIQTKLTVNKPGDKFEQEADKMADKVMRMPAPAPPAKEEKIQRATLPEEKVQKATLPEEKVQKATLPEEKVQKATLPEEKVQKATLPEEKVQKKEEEKIQKATLPEEKVQKKEEEKIQKATLPEEKVQKATLPEEKIQRQAKGEEKLQRNIGESSTNMAADTQSSIKNKTNGGQPLSSEVRSYMEPRIGADFNKVRVHNDQESARLNNQLGARAFTYQNHVFFSNNQYQPGTSDGKHLLAHELTHTVQQGHSDEKPVQRSSVPGIQRLPAPAAVGTKTAITSSQVVDISANTFIPSAKIKEEIEAQGDKGLEVRVIVNGLTAEGRVKVRVDAKGNYSSIGKGSMAVQNEWMQQLGGMYINFSIKNSEISGGYASLKPGGGNTNDWLMSLKKNASLLGGIGLNINTLPTPVNKFENGKLSLGVTGLKVEVGGFVDAQFNLLLENAAKPKIDATADIDVKGIAKGQLKLDNAQDKLAGEVSLAIDFKSFSGAAKVKYNADGTVDIDGKGAYNANKLSGEVHFVATDLEAANKFAKDAIAAAGGKENVQNAAAPAPVPAPTAGNKKRALAATGQLGFNLTTWFAGTVNVVVDGKGNITVIGKIAPPAEIELFKQRDWDKELIKFEAKAYYGIPVVGNLNLFANISLHALAKLGPAKIYNIEILGTYSTDPEVQKSIQISGSINISAYAGLRLRAEGGAGIEILSHDLKFGVGLNADIGVKAYADARPTIGYRDPGVFYISGTLEMVAQPMLGLGGDFFIAIETPWWSPLSDDRWTWPLFSKEWPLTDPIGLSATVKDYVLGSGQAPEIEMKKPEFDPSKFMTSMVDKTLPEKSGGKGEGQGKFKEDGSVPKPEVTPKKPEPKKQDVKPGKKGTAPKGDKSKAPDPKAAKELDTGKMFKKASELLNGLKGKEPYTRVDLDKELSKIKGQVSGLDLDVKQKGEKWVVTPKAGGKLAKKGVELAMKKGEGAQTAPADGEIGETVQFTAGEESHRIWVDVKGETTELMLASTPKPLSKYLAEFRIQSLDLEEGQAKKDVLQSIKESTPIVKTIESDARKAASKQIDTPQRNVLDQKIEANEKIIRPMLTNILKILNIRIPQQFTPSIIVRFTTYPGIDLNEYNRQLAMQQSAINAMVVDDWLANRMRYAERRAVSGNKSGRHPESKQVQKDLRAIIRQQLIQRLTLGENATGALVTTINADPYLKGFVVSVFAEFSETTRRNGMAESTATRKVDDWMRTKHAMHSPDQVAGGRYDQLTGLGLGEVNSDIGANWGGYDKPVHLANQLERDTKTTMQRMNIRRAFWRQVKMNIVLTK